MLSKCKYLNWHFGNLYNLTDWQIHQIVIVIASYLNWHFGNLYNLTNWQIHQIVILITSFTLAFFFKLFGVVMDYYFDWKIILLYAFVLCYEIFDSIWHVIDYLKSKIEENGL